MDVRRAIAELGINTAYNLRVVGDRLEFHLLGGRVLVWPAAEGAVSEPSHRDRRGTAADPPAPDFLLEPDRASIGSASEARPADPDLSTWSRDRLRQRAAELEIRGRSRMNKAELVQTLRSLRQAQGPE